jgi:peptidoglycan/LPS O-acetylase OafA/YrhL
MFGVLRTTLALMVMSFHLFAGMAPLGKYAVFGFYMISGYLMTLIMNESYGHTWSGRYSFTINRLLRLYPQYWAAAILSIALIFGFGPDVTSQFHESMYFPSSLRSILCNLLMMFPSWNPSDIEPRLVPPTWALTVEMTFYLLICFGLSQTFRRVKIWFCLSVCYFVGTYIAGLSWENRYFPAAAGSLPFSIGAAVYFLSQRTEMNDLYFKWTFSSLALFLVFIANCMVWVIVSIFVTGNLLDVGFYLNIGLCFLLVWGIAMGRDICAIDRRLDKLIGDLSYPIYLLHWQTAFLVSYVMFGQPLYGFSAKGLIGLICSMIAVILIAIVFVRLIDNPIQRTRLKIKARNASLGLIQINCP